MHIHRKLAATLPVLAIACHAAAQPGHDPSCYPLNTISQTYVSDNPGKLAAKDQYVFVGSWTEDVKIFDKCDPTSPQLVATIDAQGHIFLDGDILYITKRTVPSGVLMFDVSDPENPIFLNEMDPTLTHDISGIDFANSIAYLLSPDRSTLLAYDMSDPELPRLISSIADLPYYYDNLHATASHVYLGGVGLSIVDVTNPESPSIVGGLDWNTVGFPRSVYVQDGTAYLSSEHLGLVTVDVSDPSNPSVLQTGFLFTRFDLSDRIIDIEVRDDLAYLTQNSEDFNGDTVNYYYFGVVDVSNPHSIRTISFRSIEQDVYSDGIHIESNLAYLSGGSDLVVLDLSSICECTADFTDDGVLDFFDVSAFLNAFLGQAPIADLTGNGAFDFFDVSAFLNAFDAGCP